MYVKNFEVIQNMQTIKRFVSSYLYDESAFRLLYILSLFFSSVCFIELPCQIATGIFVLWSIFILSNNLLNKKVFKSINYSGILITFIVSGLFTALIHANDNLPINLLMMYHVFICFFGFYGAYSNFNKKKLKVEMYTIFKIIVISSTVLSILGLIIALFFTKVELFGYYLGLRDNRYTGLYTNPNLSSFSSVIALVFCHYLIGKNDTNKPYKKILPNFIILLCIVSNFLALLLSDSNSSLLFLIVYMTTLLFFRLYQKDRGKKITKIFKHSLILLIICSVGAFGMFFIRDACQQGAEMLINNIHKTENKTDTSNVMLSDDFTEIGRGTDYEISSGRIDSLKKAMVLYNKNPLFGIGKGNIVEYGDRYLARGFSFTDLHNGYLTILISTGTVGLTLFMIFAFMIAIRLIKKLSELDINDKSFPILFSMIVAYGVFSLFERALLFDITFMVVVFWMILGYTMSFTVDTRKVNKHEFKVNNIDDFIHKNKDIIRPINYMEYRE